MDAEPPPPDGPEQVGSDRVGSDRVEPDRVESKRVGPERVESDRVESKRVGSDRPGAGRARDLVRRRSRRRTVADTGRQHHLGGAPEAMPVFGPDTDDQAALTRTAGVQLADRTPYELERLAAQLRAEMDRAAAETDFETAAARRDELSKVRAELDRRS